MNCWNLPDNEAHTQLFLNRKYGVYYFCVVGVASMSEDALKELCPTAATTSSLLKSGMTLTQVV